METFVKIARMSYGIMIAALGVQQIFYSDFRPVILPPWPASFPGHAFFLYFLSAILIIGGLAIVFDKKARMVSLILGGVFLLLIVFCQLPYEILADPNNKNLGSWTAAMKELVFAGGAFVVAGSFPEEEKYSKKEFLMSLLEKFIPLGSIFFCATIICFGIDHFLYAEGISTLVPNWIPGHVFWTYFAGAALVSSGIAIIWRIQLKISAFLLALMIFLWLIILHIPRAIDDPYSLKGNEVSSVFEAFGFSGVAYLIAVGYNKREAVKPAFPGKIELVD
ncbi:MAG TPA: hypothetical protein VGI43_19940 [Mucilaginibacter sp.]|jgi:uncharacterized membrane protein YphA (DoxX/SURF4 family)